MKKILYYITAIAFMGTIFIACKGGDAASGGDPKTVLVAFFELMGKKDFEAAAKLATAESKSTMDMMKKAMDMGETMKDKMGEMKTDEKDPAEEFKNLKIGDAKIEGDNATVSVTNPAKDNQTIDFPLKKQDGKWKVDFSMGTLMKMGMKEAEKRKENFNSDGDTEDMNDVYNKLNTDSLKKGLEQFDSLMKSIDPEKMKEMKEAMEKLKKSTNQ